MHRLRAAELRAAFLSLPDLSADNDEPAKNVALRRAIAATPDGDRDLGNWAFADAVRIGAWWVCLLEEHRVAYIVDVHAQTGETIVVTWMTTVTCLAGRSGGIGQRGVQSYCAPRGRRRPPAHPGR